MLAVAASFAAMVGGCLMFLISGTDVPDLFVLLGRLLPGVASLVAVVALLGRDHLARLWRWRPASPRELAASFGLALVVMLPTLVLPAVAGLAFGAELEPADVLLAALPTIVMGTLLFALSTVGEEVLWRGQLQSLLRDQGFWRSSTIVGLLWMLFHVPLNLTYLAQGTLSTAEAIATTLSVAAWAPLLAALVERRGTIWPAVFAHAVPLSSLQLLTASSVAAPTTFWATNILAWVAMPTVAAVVLRRSARVRASVPV
ncbi:CPBP family intramembrane metalloprotease [Isoptericola halotolerans]